MGGIQGLGTGLGGPRGLGPEPAQSVLGFGGSQSPQEIQRQIRELQAMIAVGGDPYGSLAATVQQLQKALAAMELQAAQANQTVEEMFGSQASANARRYANELGAVKVAYMGVGAAVKTLAELEAARWESSRKIGAALMAGATINPFGGTTPATGTTTTPTPQVGTSYYGVPIVSPITPNYTSSAIPVFDQGGVMPYTGLAHLERGERVLPPGQSAPINITVGVTFQAAMMGEFTQADRRRVARDIAPLIHDELTRLGR
jgi:hypothetical protein